MTSDSEQQTSADSVPDCCAPGRGAFLVPSPAVAGSDVPADDDRG
ncbi:hypothetical protein [Cryocola sp. 340MFSha3.1]|nr:hypothetical protein [Cryocola sp. 340MFSha3.1]